MLRTLLQSTVDTWRQLGHISYLESFMLKRADIETSGAESLETLGTPKHCFQNAGYAALANSHYEYVEGYVARDDLPVPILHAWLWDTQCKVCVETTLKDGADCMYLGVLIPKHMLRKQLFENEVWGVLDPGRGIDINFMDDLLGVKKYEA